jgi:Tfp pilus assembly protein PilO
MARTRAERLWVGGGSAAGVVLAIIGWLAVVNPKLSSASSLRSEKGNIRTENDVLQAKIDKLKAADATIGQLQQDLQNAEARLPSDSGIGAFTHQIQAMAASAHVTITAISVGSPSQVIPGKTGQAAPAPAAGTVAAPGSLYSIPVTVAVTGRGDYDAAFLHALQSGTRAALVTTAQLSAHGAAGSSDTMLTVQLQVFSAPQAQQPTTQPAAG